VGDYHINADEPSVLDYNTDFKTANLQASLYAPDQFRVSDHDPVIVGLDLNVAPTVSAGESYSVDEGGNVTLNATGSDLNNDPLTYEWDLNNDGVFETAGQSVPFAGVDGPTTQTVTVRVSDDGGLSASASTTVTVNNLAPAITGIIVPTGPVNVANVVNANASFNDAGTLDTHTALWDWGDGSTSAGSVTEVNGSGSVVDGHTYNAPGLYTVTLTVTDKDGASHQAVSSTVLVYNPKGGFTTGGGWYYSPAGAYLDKPTKKGSSVVAFLVGYKKNASTPSGEFQMIFHLGGLRFKATSFDWLIIDQTAKTAQFQGSGKINNSGNYKFTVWADQDNPDTIRVKIWYSDETGEHVIYDTVENLRVFGSIVVHR
jgi:PKD repeat protein